VLDGRAAGQAKRLQRSCFVIVSSSLRVVRVCAVECLSVGFFSRAKWQAIVAVVVAALLLGAAAAPARAQVEDTEPPQVLSFDVEPEVVGLYKSRPAEIVLQAHITDNVRITEAGGGVQDGFGSPVDNAALTLVSGTVQDGVWRGSVFATHGEPPGEWLAEVFVRDAAGNFDNPSLTLPVRLNTSIRRFNVAEPARRGSYVRVYGRLIRLTQNFAFEYAGWANRVMVVWFKPAGGNTWQRMGGIRTRARGFFASTNRFVARRDGVWRVSVAGTYRHLGETSRGDFVDVR
jgi:hypothetical protein